MGVAFVKVYHCKKVVQNALQLIKHQTLAICLQNNGDLGDMILRNFTVNISHNISWPVVKVTISNFEDLKVWRNAGLSLLKA